MSTITAVLIANPDGSLHLPVPPELRGALVRVHATLEPADRIGIAPRFGCLAGKLSMAPDFDEPLEDFAEYS